MVTMKDGQNKAKFFRDPVHDIIRVEEEHIIRLIDSDAMQRLRRIRQLGMAWMVYPGAEHSRFNHSLGTYHLAKRVIRHFNQLMGNIITEEEKVVLITAALIHDVGHGPFSHLFEVLCNSDLGIKYKHEDWTKKIILEDEEVNNILKEVTGDLPLKLIELLTRTLQPYYLCDIISSQLDVDRFDYLLRDSMMTGANYGFFDQEWIMRTLFINKVRNIVEAVDEEGNPTPEIETIVVDGSKGLSTLEQYLLGRHYMYKHVYLHKTIRAAEAMLRMILKRAAHLIRAGNKTLGNEAFRKLVCEEDLAVEEFKQMNDFLILAWVQEWANSAEDTLLQDLCRNFLNRKLFKCYLTELEGKNYADERDLIKEILDKEEYEYLFVEDELKDVAYKDFFYYLEKQENPEEIWFLDGETPKPLSGYDGILTVGKDALRYNTVFWHMPADAMEKFLEMKGG